MRIVVLTGYSWAPEITFVIDKEAIPFQIFMEEMMLFSKWYWWMFHLTSEKGKIIRVSFILLLDFCKWNVESHARFDQTHEEPREKTEKAIVLYRNYGAVYTVYG